MPITAPPREVQRIVSGALGAGFWAHWFAAANRGLASAEQGAELTSWWRSVERNQAVGGHPRSQHLWGLAFDLVRPGAASIDALRREGFTVINEIDHDHVQTFPSA